MARCNDNGSKRTDIAVLTHARDNDLSRQKKRASASTGVTSNRLHQEVVMARYRAQTDLTLPSGEYVQAGSEYTTDANYLPPTHACQPLDPQAIEAYWKV